MSKIYCHKCIHYLENFNWCFETARDYPFLEVDGECPYYDEKTSFSDLLTKISLNLISILKEKNSGYGNAFFDGIEKIQEKFIRLPMDNEILYPYIHYLGIWQRLNDKLLRFFNLIFSKYYESKKEDIYDAILDLTGYGLLSLTYLDKEYNKNLGINIKNEEM